MPRERCPALALVNRDDGDWLISLRQGVVQTGGEQLAGFTALGARRASFLLSWRLIHSAALLPSEPMQFAPDSSKSQAENLRALYGCGQTKTTRRSPA